MRKIILGLAISLDGYIEDANGGYDWCFTDQDYGLQAFFGRIDAMFVGRKSYELMQRIPEAEKTYMPTVKTFVFSTTLRQVGEGDVLINANTREEVIRIKQEAGKDIWLFGGAGLTHSLMAEDLVDECWLSVHPVILGGGKPLFPETNRRTMLELLESKTYDTGLVSLRYGFVRK